MTSDAISTRGPTSTPTDPRTGAAKLKRLSMLPRFVAIPTEAMPRYLIAAFNRVTMKAVMSRRSG